MKIVADRDIFRIEEYFGGYGELHLLPGREITASQVADADALLVRTVTRVDRQLLDNSRVKFVGSASSGFDHVDREWLAGRSIEFFHAAGCNADAVVNYVYAALAWLSLQYQQDWRHWSVGIIGAGNVGSRLARSLEKLGMSFSVHDPFLPRSHPLGPQFTSLETVLQQDVVTIHTPLTRGGDYPTWHMLDASRLGSLAKEAVLVNASRGEVVDNALLASFLGERPDVRVVLDVWENEPHIHLPLLDSVDIATPHIAGYSTNGKKNGTEWVCEAFRDHFGLPTTGVDLPVTRLSLKLPDTGTPTSEWLNRAILAAYPVNGDFIANSLSGHGGTPGDCFDSLRNDYRFRPEFGDFSLEKSKVPTDFLTAMEVLGFCLI